MFSTYRGEIIMYIWSTVNLVALSVLKMWLPSSALKNFIARLSEKQKINKYMHMYVYTHIYKYK